jgi:NADPH:quinone reductase-like Zn-dependent oxidoreductase
MGSFLEDGTGGFSEYSRIPGRRAIRVPDSMPFNEATTMGAACITAVDGLYKELKLATPPAPASHTPILVWSGACILLIYGI